MYVNALERDNSRESASHLMLSCRIECVHGSLPLFFFGFYGHRLLEAFLVRVMRLSASVLLCFKVEQE